MAPILGRKLRRNIKSSLQRKADEILGILEELVHDIDDYCKQQ